METVQAETVIGDEIGGLKRLSSGKVRDIYAVDAGHLLIVTSDRLSAFDVILPDPIPDKGQVLTEVANFWFARTRDIIPNHLTDIALEDVISDESALDYLRGRAIVVKKLKPLPVEAIVRGYLIGSGWKDYQASGSVCGIQLPDGLVQAQQLPEAIYTPSTKAAIGEHDENIDYARTVELLGAELAAQVRDVSLEIYTAAAEYALTRGIIIADTKFEFGLDAAGSLVLIDEVLTPDSSRFWPADQYEPGRGQPSFDKQYVRDWLESSGWNKQPPVPELPQEIIDGTRERYLACYRILTGRDLS